MDAKHDGEGHERVLQKCLQRTSRREDLGFAVQRSDEQFVGITPAIEIIDSRKSAAGTLLKAKTVMAFHRAER